MKSKIYILYTCDDWKSSGSMNAVLYTQKLSSLNKVIKYLMDNGECEIYGDIEFPLKHDYEVNELSHCSNNIFIEEIELDLFEQDTELEDLENE